MVEDWAVLVFDKPHRRAHDPPRDIVVPATTGLALPYNLRNMPRRLIKGLSRVAGVVTFAEYTSEPF
jgi:hypothetical protein